MESSIFDAFAFVNIESSSLLLVEFNIELLFLFSFISELFKISELFFFFFELISLEFNLSLLCSFIFKFKFILLSFNSFDCNNFDKVVLLIFWLSKFSYNFLKIFVSNIERFDFEFKILSSGRFDSSFILFNFLFIFGASNF